MRLESVAVYGCSNRSCTVARTGWSSQTPFSVASSSDDKTSAAQRDGVQIFTNSDGDTLEVSAEGQEASLGQLDSAERQLVAKLKVIDQKVRSHEMAHLAAAGPYARGGPRYSYVEGPDGVSYAVGGEVPIDVSPEPGDPEATIRKAQAVRAAALAPADPSGQDRQVAAAATKMEAQARQELAVEQAESSAKETDDADAESNTQPAADGEQRDEGSCQPLTAKAP